MEDIDDKLLKGIGESSEFVDGEEMELCGSEIVGPGKAGVRVEVEAPFDGKAGLGSSARHASCTAIFGS